MITLIINRITLIINRILRYHAGGPFTDLYIGWPGLVHGARVLAYSDFYCRGEEEILFEN